MNEHLQPAQPSEQANVGSTLVEQTAQRLELQLLELFNQPESPTQFRPYALPGMLESTPTAVSHAIDDLKIFADTSLNAVSAAMYREPSLKYPKEEHHSLRLVVTPAQVLEVNHHPFTHTLSGRELAELIDVSSTMINEVVKQNGTVPVLKSKPELNGRSRHYDRYDLDQIEQIKLGLEKFNAPAGYIGESSVLGSTRISPVALADIGKRLKIKGHKFHNPELGQGELFLLNKMLLRCCCS